MKRTTAQNIHRDAHPMRSWGHIEPMAEHDRIAWAETRRLHPQYYGDAQ